MRFIACFAPVLATAIGKGGGEQLYHGIAQRAGQVAQFGVQITTNGVKLAAGVF